MRKPTLAQQVATLDALLTAERAAHAETRKQIAEALVVAPDGAIEAANEEIAELKEANAKLAAEKETAEEELAERDEELEAAQDQIDANTEYEPAFLIALEMLGMTEREFEVEQEGQRLPRADARVGGRGPRLTQRRTL